MTKVQDIKPGALVGTSEWQYRVLDIVKRTDKVVALKIQYSDGGIGQREYDIDTELPVKGQG